MEVSGQDGGRTNQKVRTRRALIQAAAELARENRAPTVAEAAQRALVSRATAYRYFPTQQSLLIELRADATQPSPQEVLAPVGDDVEARVAAITRQVTRMVLGDEALFRSQVRAMHDLWFARRGEDPVPLRQGRRLIMIDAALEPLAGRLDAAAYARLRTALAVVIGVEPVLSLRDICGLTPVQTEESLVQTASLITRAALREAARDLRDDPVGDLSPVPGEQ